MDAPEFWNDDLAAFMSWVRAEWKQGSDFDGAPQYPYQNSFFTEVAEPMLVTFRLHQENNLGLSLVHQIAASDWRLACTEWLERRELS